MNNRIQQVKEYLRLPGSPVPPRWLIFIGIIVMVASWLPLVLVGNARSSLTTKPRIHLVQDMDKQPKYRTQRSSPIFADGRTMRPRIEGTIAQGKLNEDDHYYRGFRLSNAPHGPAESSRGGGNANDHADENASSKQVFLDGYPDQVNVDEAFVMRGQERFNIYCAPCHGYDGRGNGTVQQAVDAVKSGAAMGWAWTQPANLLLDNIASQPNGQLYNTIANGKATMAAYGSQINVEDRWAIVAYVRVLQQSQAGAVAQQPAPEQTDSEN